MGLEEKLPSGFILSTVEAAAGAYTGSLEVARAGACYDV